MEHTPRPQLFTAQNGDKVDLHIDEVWQYVDSFGRKWTRIVQDADPEVITYQVPLGDRGGAYSNDLTCTVDAWNAWVNINKAKIV